MSVVQYRSIATIINPLLRSKGKEDGIKSSNLGQAMHKKTMEMDVIKIKIHTIFVQRKNMRWKIIAIGILTGLCNGLFGAGGGTILVPALEDIMKIEAHKAHATAISVILPLSIFSAVIYIYKGNGVNWSLTLSCALGGSVGGYIGAKILNKIPSLWLHRIFGFFMLVAAVRMMF